MVGVGVSSKLRCAQDGQRCRARAASERAQRAMRAERYRFSKHFSRFIQSLDVRSLTTRDPLVQLKRASRSLAKTGFFFDFRKGFIRFFGSLKAPKLRSMLELVLGGILEASRSDLGNVLGGQDASQNAPRWRQDGPRWRQDAPKTAKDASQTLEKRV